tara:strand:+ start:349 stop:516 length:168 start_codon:yes stop_codon:yes gene_type:complete
MEEEVDKMEKDRDDEDEDEGGVEGKVLKLEPIDSKSHDAPVPDKPSLPVTPPSKD